MAEAQGFTRAGPFKRPLSVAELKEWASTGMLPPDLRTPLMAEPPDFERFATAVLQRLWEEHGIRPEQIAEQLRQVWNARGAADLAKVLDDAADQGYLTKSDVTQALRDLDAL